MEQYSIPIMFGAIVVISLFGAILAPRFPLNEKRRPGVLPGRRVEGRRPPTRQR